MRQNMKGMRIMALTVAAVFGLSLMAFAGWGGRPGAGMNRSGGPGYCPQQGYYENLSPDEKAQLEQQRAEFFEATAETRRQLQEKELALRAELANQNPDTDRAFALQREISDLRGQMDQKRLEHNLQTGNTTPGGNFCGRAGGGPMRGPGGRGGGYCWR